MFCSFLEKSVPLKKNMAEFYQFRKNSINKKILKQFINEALTSSVWHQFSIDARRDGILFQGAPTFGWDPRDQKFWNKPPSVRRQLEIVVGRDGKSKTFSMFCFFPRKRSKPFQGFDLSVAAGGNFQLPPAAIIKCDAILRFNPVYDFIAKKTFDKNIHCETDNKLSSISKLFTTRQL